MNKLSKYQLSLLSLLVIVGFAVGAVTIRTNFIFIGYVIIFIGSLAFGTLLRKEIFKND